MDARRTIGQAAGTLDHCAAVLSRLQDGAQRADVENIRSKTRGDIRRVADVAGAPGVRAGRRLGLEAPLSAGEQVPFPVDATAT
jgi:hypothetical protein